MKKLFVFDIDKTIKPWFSDIPPLTRKAIELLKEKHTVVLATGRCFSEAIAVMEELGLEYLICNGGSDVYYKYEMIYQNVPDYSCEVTHLKEKRPIHFFVCDNGIYSYRFSSFLKKLSIFRHFYSKTSSIYGLINMLGRVEPATTIEKMGTPHKFYVLGKYEGLLDYKHLGNIIHTFEYEDKAVGVKYIDQILGKFDEIICFGDSSNDLTMFEIATRCYANEKGNEKLKFFSTDTFNIKDGIYKIVLEELDV